MQLPSIKKLQDEAVKAFSRFPLAILTGLTISIIGIVLIETEASLSHETLDRMYKTVLALVFAFPLFGSLSLLKERNKWETDKIWLSNAAVIAITVFHYLFILGPTLTEWTFTQSITTFLLTVVAYLCSTFLPYINKTENIGFWHYNLTLAKAISISAIYCGILFAGISLTYLSVDYLFDISVHDKLYAETFVFIAGIIAPLSIFAQVPKSLDALDKEKDPSHLIKFLAQYILVPLVSVYTVILYLYAGKILISQDWPKGVIGWMIIIYAVIGIVTIIALYPFKEKTENSWMETYSKWFYVLLIPITALLFAAIGIRLSNYGITESRYYVLILGVWLVALSTYFIFSKKKDLKLITLSVGIVILLSLFGPWSSFSISQHSQETRLENILIKTNVIGSENIQIPSAFNKDDETEIRAIIHYLGDYHDLKNVALWLKQDSKEFASLNTWDQKTKLFNTLKIEAYDTDLGRPFTDLYFYSEEQNTTKINENTYLSSFFLSSYNTSQALTPAPAGKNLNIVLSGNTISIQKADKSKIISLDLESLINTVKENNRVTYKQGVPAKDMTANISNNELNLTVHIKSFNLQNSNSNIIENIEGNILIEFKRL